MADGRLCGAPRVEQITRALAVASAGSARGLGPASRVGRRLLPALPASVLTLIPVGKCPACWPMYGTLLGTLGLGFLLDAKYLLPLTLLCLAAALFGLGHRARSRRGFAPLVLGVIASFLLVASKFFIQSAPGTYVATALLLAAALWNGWSRRSGQVACPDCVDPSSLSNPWR